MKEFNTTAVCVPSKHYMVDLTERVDAIKRYVDKGKYLSINRARQYGKTTTITLLSKRLDQEYRVINLDFQDIEAGSFSNGGEFSKAFSRILLDAAVFEGLEIPEDISERFELLNLKAASEVKLDDLFRIFKFWFIEDSKTIVLIIDEVDSAANNQVFLDFLAQLRSLYLKRERNPQVKTFQSVILAGVTDIKHLKSKIQMNLSQAGIRDMLSEYDKDHHIGMETDLVAREIRDYTSGYPFLVSKICQIMDTSKELKDQFGEESRIWTKYGVDEAVRLLLKEEDVSLFDSLMGKLTNYPDMKEQLYGILMRGEEVEYLPYDEGQKQLRMYGFIKEHHNKVAVANRIFETLLYNHFLGIQKDGNPIRQAASLYKNQFVKNGKLDVPLIMERFISAFTQIYGNLEDKFKEREGREYFLLFLKPIINGTGNYYIEAQTRDQKRTDIIVDYLGKQYIIELKIWHGERYNAEGEKQLKDYLDYWQLDTGYMLSFNFNKKKEQGIKEIHIGNKVLYEGTV